MLGSRDSRAKYVATVLADPQRPFIWEFYRPGTIPLAGERAFYDEVFLTFLICLMRQMMNFPIETKGAVPI